MSQKIKVVPGKRQHIIPNDKVSTRSKKSTENTKLPIVKESLVAYTPYSIERVSNKASRSNFLHLMAPGGILPDAANKPESQMTPMEKMDMIRAGISKKDLESLKDKAALDYDKLAKALSVTRATLINKKRNEKFNSPLSERIVGLADIYSYGYEVFEAEDRFNQWMFRPNKALRGQAPYELLDNQFGREEVRNIIGRIAYGVYS